MRQSQNHIHLDTQIVPDQENAPAMRWKVVQRQVFPVVFMGVKRAVNGTLRLHTLKRDNQVVDLENYTYVVKCEGDSIMTTEEKREYLFKLLGRRVFLVDSVHCPDGHDHTQFVRKMVVINLSEASNFDPMLSRYYIQIALEDDRL